ncbi:MAG: hypothetical protein RLZZ351_781 [Pseudomonadota bacterium]
MGQIAWLGPNDPFPNPLLEADPDPSVPGLIAVSEQIYPGQLARAYQQGIFPWYSDNQPVLWWSPDPRMVLKPSNFKCSDSLRKIIRLFCQNSQSQVEVDGDFGAVIRSCATSARKDQDGTWITESIIDAYCALHDTGLAMSAETWIDGQLVGGLYGVKLGRMFYGESMFHHVTDASKIAFVHMVHRLESIGVELIDCQMKTSHLSSLGAKEISRDDFIRQLKELITV